MTSENNLNESEMVNYSIAQVESSSKGLRVKSVKEMKTAFVGHSGLRLHHEEALGKERERETKRKDTKRQSTKWKE